MEGMNFHVKYQRFFVGYINYLYFNRWVFKWRIDELWHWTIPDLSRRRLWWLIFRGVHEKIGNWVNIERRMWCDPPRCDVWFHQFHLFETGRSIYADLWTNRTLGRKPGNPIYLLQSGLRLAVYFQILGKSWYTGKQIMCPNYRRGVPFNMLQLETPNPGHPILAEDCGYWSCRVAEKKNTARYWSLGPGCKGCVDWNASTSTISINLPVSRLGFV